MKQRTLLVKDRKRSDIKTKRAAKREMASEKDKKARAKKKAASEKGLRHKLGFRLLLSEALSPSSGVYSTPVSLTWDNLALFVRL